jgi:hypothetical protein
VQQVAGKYGYGPFPLGKQTPCKAFLYLMMLVLPSKVPNLGGYYYFVSLFLRQNSSMVGVEIQQKNIKHAIATPNTMIS